MIKKSGNDEIVRPLFVVTSETDQRRICFFREEFERARVFERTHDVLFLEDKAVRRLKFRLKYGCETTVLVSETCLQKQAKRQFLAKNQERFLDRLFEVTHFSQERRTGIIKRKQDL